MRLCETLQHLSEGDFVPDKLGDYYDLVPRVARFSFSVSILPEYFGQRFSLSRKS